MEAPIDLQDWELLSDSDPLAPNLKPLDPIDHDTEDGAIKSDYFSLNPIKLKPQQSEDEADSGSVDSDNPSWLDPDLDSRDQSRGQLDLSVKNSASFWSDVSSEGPRSVADETEELGVDKEEELGGGEVVKGESSEESSGICGERVWWRMPLEILKVWVLRARPVWSISIAAAIVGVVMLGKRLYKMKQKGRSFPLNISLDDKVRGSLRILMIVLFCAI